MAITTSNSISVKPRLLELDRIVPMAQLPPKEMKIDQRGQVSSQLLPEQPVRYGSNPNPAENQLMKGAIYPNVTNELMRTLQ